MKILVTGGTGYIGSHTCCELLNEGYEVIIIDNLVNSKREVVDKIKTITGKDVKFYEDDCCNADALRKIFKENDHIDAVIHFAGLKAVGESVKLPIRYYENNLGSTLSLVKVMQEFNCHKIVFSSSATVYGDPEELPITELATVGGTTNPYGTTKYFIERILKDVSNYVNDKYLIAFEIGNMQSNDIRELAYRYLGNIKVEIKKDLSLNDRMLFVYNY